MSQSLAECSDAKRLKMNSNTFTKPLTFVTGNPKKLDEVFKVLGKDFPYKIINKKIDLPEIQGADDEITINKCKEAAKIVQGPVIIEDVSLGFGAMKGLPGPYIKWFIEKLGCDGLCKMLDGYTDRSAVAKCTFAFSTGRMTEEIKIFHGIVPGEIVKTPRGCSSFGWDNCFQPNGYTETYGEMDPDLKNRISHRRVGITEMCSFWTSSSGEQLLKDLNVEVVNGTTEDKNGRS